MPAAWSFQAYLYGAQRGPLAVSLDAVAASLAERTSCHFEWDGSFAAAGPEGWQLSGTLFDSGRTIQYVDVHGRVDRDSARNRFHESLSNLLIVLAAGETPAMPSTEGWGQFDEQLTLLRLPSQKWQTLQSLEQELLAAV